MQIYCTKNVLIQKRSRVPDNIGRNGQNRRKYKAVDSIDLKKKKGKGIKDKPLRGGRSG